MNYRILWLVILTFVLILACAPRKKAEPPPRALTIPVVVNGTTFDSMVFLKGFIFFFPRHASKTEKTLCLMGAMEQLRVFEEHIERKSQRCSVYLFPTKSVPCGERRGRFIGCCHRPGGPIYIIMGRHYSASVFYHELAHLNDNQPEHDNPMWENFWIPEQKKLRERIEEEHYELLKNKHGS